MRTLRLAMTTISALLLTFAFAAASFAAAQPKGLLEQLGLPAYPGAKLVREINLPAGKALDQIAKEFGPVFGLKELKQVSLLVFRVDNLRESDEVLDFYAPTIARQEWKIVDKRVEEWEATAIYFNEKKGMLIISINPPAQKQSGRTFTISRLFGTIDPAKMADPEGKLPEMLEQMASQQTEGPDVPQTASGIPIGQPISIPPAEKLHIKSNRSAVIAEIVDGSTAQILASGKFDESGEMTRMDERLVLSLASRFPVDRILAPASFPVLFEATEGSLSVKARSGRSPAQLSIVSVNAPVKVEDFPLTSGVHMVKATGAGIVMGLSSVEGGELVLSVTGDDVELAVPKNASVEITGHATKGRVRNLMSSTPEIEEQDQIKLILGAGKARISLESVNGNVCIKSAD